MHIKILPKRIREILFDLKLPKNKDLSNRTIRQNMPNNAGAILLESRT